MAARENFRAVKGRRLACRSLPFRVDDDGREEGDMRSRALPLAVLAAALALAATLSAGASVPRVIMAEEFGSPS